MYEQLAERRAGRRDIILDIVRASFACVGLTLSSYDSRACVMDFQGRLLNEKKLDLPSFGSAKELEDHLCREIADMESFCKVEKLHLVGVGISLRGIVNDREGIWVDPYQFIPEKHIALRAHLERRVDHKITIEDNVRAMASAELLLSGDTSANGVLFLKYGPGLGGAFCIDSDIYHGARFQASELGHLLVWNPDGSGLPVQLEELVSYHAIEKHIQLRYSAELYPVLFQNTGGNLAHVSILEIFNAYSEGDPGVSAVLRRCQQNLLYTIQNAVSLFDPQKIVLYGDAFENERFYSGLVEMLHGSEELGAYHECIGKSLFNTDLAMRGAAALALRTFLESSEL